MVEEKVPPGAAGADSQPETTAEAMAQHEEIVRFLVRSGATRDVSEDIASEAILRLWSRIGEGLRPQSRRAYVHQIARNLLVDQVRQETRERLRLEQLAAVAAIGTMIADEIDAVTLAVAVDVARRELPHRFQEVLLCTLDLGMTRAETAAAMGLATPGAAAVMAHRARKALMERLGASASSRRSTGES